MNTEIEPEKAVAIARGEDQFDTVALVPATTLINRALRRAVIILVVVTILASSGVVAMSIFRGYERRSFDRATAALSEALTTAERQVSTLNGEVNSLRTELRDTQQDLECRAAANLETDAAQAEVIIGIAEQFARLLAALIADDASPPDPSTYPDPTLLASAALVLRASLVARAAAVQTCDSAN
jgi:Tfp pilus assembly protein PilE